jgi:metal-responsive CopG/Arc/MetJ family transcriptional regulator
VRKWQRIKRVNIRVELDGELAQMFNELKGIRGLKNNSELVRQLITEAKKREAVPLEVVG